MMVVSVQGESPTFGVPHPVFEAQFPAARNVFWGSPDYDVSADGQRFVAVQADEPAPLQCNMVTNWFEELNRLVPTN